MFLTPRTMLRDAARKGRARSIKIMFAMGQQQQPESDMHRKGGFLRGNNW